MTDDLVSSAQRSPTAPPDAKLSDETNLLRRFEHDVELAGLVGEQRNAQIVFLAAISAKLPKPLNLNVGGASAAGKNHLIGTVARFIPDENKTFLTGMSPKALMHSGEDEFRYKAVFIAEQEGISGADYAVRTMQSEQVIEWQYAESTNQGIHTKRKRVKGPAAFIHATTRVTLHPENETRLLFTQVDESAAQTRAIMERQAKEAASGTSPVPPGIFAAWHDLLRSLRSALVRIPFAEQLAAGIPDTRVRSRRDFPKLLALIEASAFLHQHRRAPDGDRNIVAVPEDYTMAKVLFEHCYHTGPDSAVSKLVKIGDALSSDFSVTDLMRGLGWGQSKTYEVLGRAEDLGYIGLGSERGRYQVLHNQVDVSLTLPAKIRLTADNFRISAGNDPGIFRNSAIPRPGG